MLKGHPNVREALALWGLEKIKKYMLINKIQDSYVKIHLVNY